MDHKDSSASHPTVESQVAVAEKEARKDIQQLFSYLKGCEDDKTVSTTALLYLFDELQISESDPDYYLHLTCRFKDKEDVTKEEFEEALLCPPSYGPDDAAELAKLFESFDVKQKGSVSKEDFIELLKETPFMEPIDDDFEHGLSECFEQISYLYGNSEITPIEFFQLMTSQSED